jgi:dienelactone hydrolase
VKHHWALLVLLFQAAAVSASEAVQIPGVGGLQLEGRLYRPDGAGPFPAVVMLHGCSGLWAKGGRPTPTYDDWAQRLQAKGFIAVLVDSFGPRGQKEICTQKERAVSESTDRPRDAYAAVDWLAARADVRRDRIHLMGWSNGGSTVLHSLRPDAPGRAEAKASIRSAVAFYPGCDNPRLRDFRPVAPLLIQAGGADDWTPARACEDLAKRSSQGGPVEIDVYPGAHHAFDRIDGAIRSRPNVRNRASPSGWGATVGPNPEAREAARARTFAFLDR